MNKKRDGFELKNKNTEGKKIENGELTNVQLENLEDFLKKCNYSKEELVTESDVGLSGLGDLKRLGSLKRKYKIRSSKKNMQHLIQVLIQNFDLNWLISKIAFDLHIKYDKTISQGQAEAIIRRVLGIKLSSTGRSQLHELRKKIQKYKRFLTYFEEWGKQEDYTLKVIIMGLKDEQKNKLFPIPSEVEGSNITIGVEFHRKMVEIYDKIVELQIWDVTGNKKFSLLRPKYYLGATGAIITYDKGDRESFELAKKFYSELKKVTNLKFKLKEIKGVYVDISITLIGFGESKLVTSEEGQSLAKELGAYYYEMSEIDEQIFGEALSYLSLQVITRCQKMMGKRY